MVWVTSATLASLSAGPAEDALPSGDLYALKAPAAYPKRLPSNL
mgnify:CR=1 FL=1